MPAAQNNTHLIKKPIIRLIKRRRFIRCSHKKNIYATDVFEMFLCHNI